MSSKLVKFWVSGVGRPIYINPQVVAVVGCYEKDRDAPTLITLNTGGEIVVNGDVNIVANMIAIALLGVDPNDLPRSYPAWRRPDGSIIYSGPEDGDVEILP